MEWEAILSGVAAAAGSLGLGKLIQSWWGSRLKAREAVQAREAQRKSIEEIILGLWERQDRLLKEKDAAHDAATLRIVADFREVLNEFYARQDSQFERLARALEGRLAQPRPEGRK